MLKDVFIHCTLVVAPHSLIEDSHNTQNNCSRLSGIKKHAKLYSRLSCLLLTKLTFELSIVSAVSTFIFISFLLFFCHFLECALLNAINYLLFPVL